MTEIKLTVNVDDLRDIYFGERHQVYFFGPRTKRQSILLVVALVVFPFLSWYALTAKDNILFFLAAGILAFASYDFWRVSQPIIRWKKSVEAFLKKTAMIKEAKIAYDNETITYTQGEDETKLSWSGIREATLTERSVILTGTDNLIFPKSSMSPKEFNDLAKIVAARVPNVIKTKI